MDYKSATITWTVYPTAAKDVNHNDDLQRLAKIIHPDFYYNFILFARGRISRLTGLLTTHFIKYCTPIPCILEFLHSFQRHRNSHTEICTLLGYYAAYSCNYLPTFPDNLSVPSSRVKKSGVIRCVMSHMSAELISIAADSWNHA